MSNTKNSKLATFRIDEQLWEQFGSKAKEAGDTASAILLRAVRSYLNGVEQKLTNTESGSVPSIYLAIAPDHQILYIDRAINSPQWSPPYQLRQTDARFEWLSSSDSSLLSALEDVLISAFDPPLNFRPKSQSQPSVALVAEEPRYTLPPEIGAKVEHLLSNGFTALDVLRVLDQLSQPQIETKPELKPELIRESKTEAETPPQPQPAPEQEPPSSPTPQIDNAVLQHLEALTQSVTKLQEQFNDRISAVEQKLKKKPKKLSQPSKPQDKDAPKPKQFKGTASLDQIPQQPENTRALAKRWGISDKILTRQRQRYQDRPDGFFHYSLEKEGGKFGWIYDPDHQLFYALTELPNSLRSAQSKAIAKKDKPHSNTSTPKSDTSPQSLPVPLTAAELGQRFISPKTGKPISARGIVQAVKRSDPQSFAEYCRKRDPDGLAWRYDHKIARFIVSP